VIALTWAGSCDSSGTTQAVVVSLAHQHIFFAMAAGLCRRRGQPARAVAAVCHPDRANHAPTPQRRIDGRGAGALTLLKRGKVLGEHRKDQRLQGQHQAHRRRWTPDQGPHRAPLPSLAIGSRRRVIKGRDVSAVLKAVGQLV